MTSSYQIIVRNQSKDTMWFYCFQEQAQFSNSGLDPDVQSSSLDCGQLPAYSDSGAQFDISLDVSVYAGAKRANNGQNASATAGFFATDLSLANSSEYWAKQEISLTPASGSSEVANHTSLSLSPLGLSQPVWNADVPAGCFGIGVPVYSPSSSSVVYCGNLCVLSDQSLVLSSFVEPAPNSDLSCAPTPKYFVKAGKFSAGTVIAYAPTGAAVCVFSGGYTSFLVEYQSNGEFTVSGN